MSVSVDVDTGSRRILEYLFSPIVDITASAMHER
jgi:hemolysin D